MTGPAKLDGNTILGSFHAHQVPLPKAKTDDNQLGMLQSWLDSYDIHSLLVTHPPSEHQTSAEKEVEEKLTKEGSSVEAPDALFKDVVLRILPPRADRRMGMIKETYNGYTPLDVPDFRGFVSEKADKDLSPMKAVAGNNTSSLL